MLCDDILANDYLPHIDGFDTISEQIRRAHKFVLSSDFAHAADGLVGNDAELRRAIPFCRLPYDTCWFEVAQSDRPSFFENDNAHLYSEEEKRLGLSAISKVGILCVAQGRSSFWKSHLFWRFKPSEADAVKAIPINGSFCAVLMDTEGDEVVKFSASRRRPIGSDWSESFMCWAEADFGNETMNRLKRANEREFHAVVDASFSDWGGEAGFLVASLALLNARNVAATERPAIEKLNKARARAGKKPLFSYEVLKIRPTHAGAGGTRKERDGETRAHFVRGHFKHRRTGLFWWGPHMRGDLAIGFVSKDYRLER